MDLLKASSLHVVVVLVPFPLIFFIFLKVLSELRSPLKRMPGPFYTRLTALVLLFETIQGRKLTYLHSLTEKYGPIVRLTPKNVLLGDPDDIRTVLTNPREFGKSLWYQDRGGPAAIITERNLKLHGVRRRHFGFMLSNTEIHKLEPVIRKKVQLAVDRIGEESHKCGEVDVLKWFTFMATDVIGDLSFGDSFRMLERGEKNEYITILENIMLAEVIRLDFPILYKFLKLTRISNLFNNVGMAKFMDYGSTNLKRLREGLHTFPEDMPPTFFGHILHDEKQRGLSDIQLTQQATEFIFAGSDTTSSSLTFLLWAVLQRPSIKKRLADEVASIPEGLPVDQLEQAPYLNAVLSETLRLYGAASGDLPREVSTEGKTFQGFYLPRGTEIDVQTHTMQRSAKYFTDPERFNPDRWLDATPEMKACFMPFGGSSRICLGIHLAYIEMRLAIASFFRKYPNAELTGRTTETDMEILNFAVNSPKGRALYVRV